MDPVAAAHNAFSAALPRRETFGLQAGCRVLGVAFVAKRAETQACQRCRDIRDIRDTDCLSASRDLLAVRSRIGDPDRVVDTRCRAFRRRPAVPGRSRCHVVLVNCVGCDQRIGRRTFGDIGHAVAGDGR